MSEADIHITPGNPPAAERPVLARVIAIVTMALGLAVLLGWALEVDMLKQLLSGMVSMKANTAAAFALSGACLYLHTLDTVQSMQLLIRRASAALVSLLGLVTLCEYYFGWNAGIDQLLFSESDGAVLTSHPGRMSVITAVNFALSGGACLLMEAGLWKAAQVTALAVLASTLIPVGGLMFGNLSLTQIGNTTAIAAHTAMGFLMLNTGILRATLNHGFTVLLREKMLSIATAASLGTLFVILVAAFYNFTQKDVASQWVEHTYKIFLEMESFSESLHDYLYHNRGFLITGDEQQLEERNKSQHLMLEKLARVHQLTSHDAGQQQRLLELDELVRQRIERSDHMVQVRREKGREVVAAMISSAQGNNLLAGIEAKLDELKNAEDERLKERQRKAEAVNSSSLFTLIILAVASFILLFVVFRTSRKEIAERKQAEQALRTSEERFRSVFNHSKVGINVLDPDYKYLKVNRAFCDMTGYSEQELLAHDFKGITHPDDIEPNWAQARKLVAGEIDFFHMQKRYIRKDGGLMWGDLTVSAVRGGDGGLIHVIAIIQDITERKQAEEELQLAAMVYGNSSEAMMITDAANRIISVNPSFTQVTGYAAGEAIGRTPAFLGSGQQDKMFYQAMWHALNTSGHWQGEIWNRHKNGELYAEMLTINTIRGKDGSIHRHVAQFSDITEKKKAEDLIWKQANFDLLTGLPNRHMFRDRLAQEIRKSQRTNLPLALMFIDLDRFKEINDTLGHDMGDTLLIEAARRIGDCVRATDMVARLGGDEFTVILAEIDEVSSVERIVQHILQKLAEPFQLGNEMAYVSASIGITLYPNDASVIEDLLKNADQAMYVAKEQGRNRHSYFTHSMQEAAQTKLKLINDLRGALAANQFMVHFQPIVELATGRVTKAEALIRWRHPERGMVSPMEFIPLAEETGLIFEIGDWVFQESMRWAKRWRELYCAELQVSVNKSPIQFYKDGDDHSAWLNYMRSLGLPGQSLVIEITEGLLLHSEAPINGALLTFRDAGIQVAIDDFGTGYSSLSYLKKFDIDYLKIDKSFTSNLASGSSDMALSEAIVVMAHKLGLKVIAEGVETEAQRNLLAAAGCDYAQGYLYSKPVPAEEFEVLLKGK